MILFVLTDMSKQEFVIHQKINLMLGSSFGYIYIHTVVLFGMEIKWETLCPDCSKMHFYNIRIKTSEIIRKTRHLFHWRFKVQLTFTIITLKVYHYNTLKPFKIFVVKYVHLLLQTIKAINLLLIGGIQL